VSTLGEFSFGRRLRAGTERLVRMTLAYDHEGSGD
jgi:hypothetical protein